MGFKDRLSELFGRDDRVGAERRRIRADHQRIRAGRGATRACSTQATPRISSNCASSPGPAAGSSCTSSPRPARPTPRLSRWPTTVSGSDARVGGPRVARGLALELGVPVYDAAIVGYPAAMRAYRRPDDRTT